MTEVSEKPIVPDGLIIPDRLIIEGITKTGKAFRPSDWAERLCGVMSVFGADQQIRYSQHVRPSMMDGVRCVVLEGELARLEPRAYRFCSISPAITISK